MTGDCTIYVSGQYDEVWERAGGHGCGWAAHVWWGTRLVRHVGGRARA